MLSRDNLFTILSKGLILFVNFIIVVFTARIWGSEGRGEIAFVIANVSIITIFSNIFCGSTVAYNTRGRQRELLLIISLAGAILTSVAGAVVFSILFKKGYFIPLFLISFLVSINSAIASYWLGKKDITKYNLLSLLGPSLILGILLLLYYVFGKTNLDTYFRAYYLGYGVLLLLALISLARERSFTKPDFILADLEGILSYGVKNEFNYLLQFLNYRLSYYFIVLQLGMKDLGIFSVAVSITEAVWIISRSMSAVHFANVINSEDKIQSINEASLYAKQSFLISILILAVAIAVPDKIYSIVFGEEFSGLRDLVLYLSPGIIAIAVSNLFGHYFAGRGRLNILSIKSLIGLAVTLLSLPLMLKKFQMTGACIAVDLSYICSSLYLWIMFRKEIRIRDNH
jgi:O-antigen/teichoic acid export membrane protein